MNVNEAREITSGASERQRTARQNKLAREAIEKQKFWNDLAKHRDDLVLALGEHVRREADKGFTFTGYSYVQKVASGTNDARTVKDIETITDAIAWEAKEELETNGFSVSLSTDESASPRHPNDAPEYYEKIFGINW